MIEAFLTATPTSAPAWEFVFLAVGMTLFFVVWAVIMKNFMSTTNLSNLNRYPFALIQPYQGQDDSALAVFNQETNRYILGDGDQYGPDEMVRVWGAQITWLAWSEVESLIIKGKASL